MKLRKMNTSILHRYSRRAFTLIEIMVATVIMVILVGLVIQITSEVLKVWNRSSGKLAANAEARIAMDLLTQDLETAVFRNNGQQWLRVEAPRDTEESGGSLYTNQTVALKLFSPALDRDQSVPGDICAIGYRLAFKESYADGENVYALYRKIVDPQTTFNSYMGSSSDPSSPQSSLGASSGADWSEFGGGSITDSANYLASNIVEFKVLLYENDGVSTNLDPVNGDEDGNVDKTYAYGGVADGAQVLGSFPLVYADIILTVISDEGLELLQRFDTNGAFGGYSSSADIVREFGEVFTRRVNFMARPL